MRFLCLLSAVLIAVSALSICASANPLDGYSSERRHPAILSNIAVDQEDGLPAGGSIPLIATMRLSPGFHFAAGQVFGFNLPPGATSITDMSDQDLTSSYTILAGPRSSDTPNADQFIIKLAGNMQQRTFAISGIGLVSNAFFRSPGEDTGFTAFVSRRPAADSQITALAAMSTVPEPGTIVLVGTGVIALIRIRRRRFCK